MPRMSYGGEEGGKMAAAAAAAAGPGSERKEADAALRQCAAQLRPGAEPGRRLQALLALRRKHLKEPGADERFRGAGGVRRLLGIVQRHNNNNNNNPPGERPGSERRATGNLLELELSLSILANCCTREGARAEVRKLGGIVPLVSILKASHTVSVLNRAARALGNLALETGNSVTIHRAGAVPPLIGLLTLTEEADCLQTALRTLRILSDTPCHRRALTAQGLVPPLVAVMSREEPGLLGAACRAAAELTRCCSAPCALQLSRHGGIPRLSSLAGHEQRAVREGALSTLGNLCVQGFVRPSVGGAGGVGLLLGALRSDPASPAAPAHLRALCLCCREAVNRARVREDGGLDLLVSLLKEPGHRASHPRVLGALLAFFYDQAAIDYLHARGLVAVLLAQLLRLSGVRPGALATHPLPQDGREAASFDYPLERPVQGEELPAEASSSFLSLRSWLLTEGYIESPDELLLPGPSGESEMPLWLAPEREEAEGGAADRPGEASSCSRSEAEAWLPETPVLLLLSRFSQAEDPAPSLLTEHSVRVFLDYLSQAPAPSARCSRILVRLVCNPNCLEALLRARAVPLLRAQLVHGWRPPTVSETAGDSGGDWTRTRGNKELGEVLLRNLSVQAESPFGAGAVTHLLLSGSRSERERCGIALPLLCRNETLRRKLLLDHGGLHLLLETLLGSEDPVTTFGAADGLAWILGSSSPGAELPPAAPLPSPRADPRCQYGELAARAADLRLLLDGGEQLAASRSLLCRGSEVFAAMLGEGGPPRYLEWSQREVKVRGLALDVGQVLVHHLHGCQAEEGCPVLAPLLLLLPSPPEGDSPELETSLLGRSLAASSQFLLSELGCHLQELAARRLRALPASQLPAACLFAERHSLPGLRAACLRQLLLRQPPLYPPASALHWRQLAENTADLPALHAALRALVSQHV